MGYHSNCGNAGTIKLKCDVPLSLFLSKNLGEYLGFFALKDNVIIFVNMYG